MAPVNPANCRLTALLVAGALSVTARVLAADACPLRVDPATPPLRWSGAVQGASTRLRALEAPHDCGAVSLTIGGDGHGTLRFRTLDGRDALRRLENPSDLEPSLDALLVTRPVPSAPLAGPDKEKSVALAAPRSDKPSVSVPNHVVVAGAIGARVAAGPGAYIAPTFTARADSLVGPWDLGVFVDVAPSYHPFDTAPDGFTLTSYSLGLLFGRREPVGGITLAYAALLAMHRIEESANSNPQLISSRSIDAIQPRVGVLAQAIVPVREALAVVVGLQADAAVAKFRDPGTAERELPNFTRYGFSVTVGVEASLL